MKIISVMLYVAAVGFCVLGLIGHSAACCRCFELFRRDHDDGWTAKR